MSKIKRVLCAAAMTLTMAGGLTAAATSVANASPTVTTQQTEAAQARWLYYDWYWGHSTCADIGETGVAAGRWQAWDCQPGLTGALFTWHLYIHV